MRRSMKLSFFVLILLIGGGTATLYVLLRHEPDWFQRAEVPAGAERREASIEFEGRAIALQQQIRHESAQEWSFSATDREVNSWLAEDFRHHKFDRDFGVPPEISDIRIAFRDGKLLVAFRYGRAALNSVISLEAKVWLSPSEPNVLGVQFDDVRAGAIPFGIKSFQETVTEAARKQNIDIQWYRNDEKPTALVRFQVHRREPTFRLQEVSLKEGEFRIRGRAFDPDRSTGNAP